VFVRSGTTWTQQAYLKASNTDFADNFGISVAIDQDTIVVGADGESSFASGVNGNQLDNTASKAGAAYVFVRSGASWTQQAYLKASNPEEDDHFGNAVAVHGDRIAVAAEFEDSSASGIDGSQRDNGSEDSGAVYVFERSGTTWTQDAYIKASNTDTGDSYGASLGLSGNTLAVGARLEESNATGIGGDQSNNALTYSGAVYVYENNGGSWSQQAYIKASNADAFDFFGSDLNLQSDFLIVGAYAENSATVGVDGNQSDNSASSAGAAYVFERMNGNWTQISYLKASNTEEGDVFGNSVAITQDYAAAGAFAEQSAAIGLDGDQSDNTADRSGAAYIFARVPTFSVGGTVTGLVGSGLELRLNDDEVLPVAVDGTYQFDTELLDGDSYDVEILSPPASPFQVCELVNNSGTIQGDDIVDLDLNCSAPPARARLPVSRIYQSDQY